MTDVLRMPSQPSGNRLVLAINNPKARMKSGERHPFQIRLAIPSEELDESKLAILDQIESLMVELMRPASVPAEGSHA